MQELLCFALIVILTTVCSLPPEMCVASLLVLLAFSRIPRECVHVMVLLCGMKPKNLHSMLLSNNVRIITADFELRTHY